MAAPWRLKYKVLPQIAHPQTKQKYYPQSKRWKWEHCHWKEGVRVDGSKPLQEVTG